MYDELIKRLRYAASYDERIVIQDAKDAADVIEELQKQLQKSEEDNVNLTGWLAEEHAKHLWIPVTERLPEYMKNVLVTDGIDVGMGWYDIYKRRDTGIIDKYWCTPNCDVDSDNVKYWAEMPEPPESEGE